MAHVKKHKVNKKPSKKVIKLARKYKVKISLKRGSKRVYKSEKLILKQVKKKMRTLRKSRKSARKVVRKTRRTRRSRFGGLISKIRRNLPGFLPESITGHKAAEKREIDRLKRIKKLFDMCDNDLAAKIPEYNERFPNEILNDPYFLKRKHHYLGIEDQGARTFCQLYNAKTLPKDIAEEYKGKYMSNNLPFFYREPFAYFYDDEYLRDKEDIEKLGL
jgi:hypothetical protein